MLLDLLWSLPVVSFLSWVLTILAPCVLPLLPVILGASVEDSKDKYKPYIIIASLSVSIIVFSLLLKASTILIDVDPIVWKLFSWVILIVFGIITIFPNLWKNFSTKVGFAWKSSESLWKNAQKKGLFGSIMVGMSLWPVFASCSPTYGVILAVILPSSLAVGLVNLFAYVLWLAVILLLIAKLGQRFISKAKWASNPDGMFKKVLGVLFLAVWIAIISGYDKVIETAVVNSGYFDVTAVESKILEKVKIDNYKNTTMNEKNLKNAYFAWWCFWCMEGIFEAQEWVKEARTWYIGGTQQTATYEQIGSWLTKHREGVKIIYNPEKISYAKLVELFWTQIDPTNPDGQFTDKWFQYTTAIFYDGEEEKNIAEKSKSSLIESKKFEKEIATKVLPVVPFYEAEEYHQDYYKKWASRAAYKRYEKWSGRKDYKEKNWGSPLLVSPKGREITQDELKNKLTELQYSVTQEWGTEEPFDNLYWDNKAEGIYVDIVDGTPLYSSLDKYKSWTGWPSFTKPIDIKNVEEKEDNTFFSTRTEIKWAKSGAHIWHVFTDWPEDKWGLRYCMNSAAMKFIAKEDLAEKGYWEYVELFK